MILITGHSHKLDGIAFVAVTNDVKEALRMFCEAWNERFTDQRKLVTFNGANYLLDVDTPDEVVEDFEDECPRREGHVLYCNEFEKSGDILWWMPW